MKNKILFLVLFVMFNFVYAKEVFDTNLKITCSLKNKTTTETSGKNKYEEELEIEVKKIDWNKDASKPPAWGSMSNIKIKLDEKKYEASLLLSTKENIAFSYVNYANESDADSSVAHLYELNLKKLELKKTSISLFSNSMNSIKNTILICKK